MGSFSKGCLVHYTEQHIQVRKDFLDLCAYDKSQYNTDKRSSGKTKRNEPNQECMAKILRLLETLTDKRRDTWHLKNEARIAKKLKPLPEPTEYRIALAYSTIVRLLYDTYGESTIRNSIAALIQMGYIKRYQATKNSVPEYELNIPFLQTRLQEQAAIQDECEVLNVTPEASESLFDQSEVLKTTSQGVNSTPEPVNVTPQGVNSTPNNIENKKIHNTFSKKGENEGDSQHREHHQNPSLLSPDQQTFFTEIYCHSKICKVVPDHIDEKLQRIIADLMKHTKTVEELDSLYEYVQKSLMESNLKDKMVYPGNLTSAKHLNGWLQEKERKAKELANMDPYTRACMISAGEIQPTEEEQRQWLLEYYSQSEINGMTNFAAPDLRRSLRREKKHAEQAALEQVTDEVQQEEKPKQWRHPVLISPEARKRNRERLFANSRKAEAEQQ